MKKIIVIVLTVLTVILFASISFAASPTAPIAVTTSADVVKIDAHKKVNASIVGDDGSMVGKIELNLPQPKFYRIEVPAPIINVTIPNDDATPAPTSAPTVSTTSTVVETETAGTSSARKKLIQICAGLVSSTEVFASADGFNISENSEGDWAEVSLQGNINEYCGVRITENLGDKTRTASYMGSSFGTEHVQRTPKLEFLFYPMPELNWQPFVGIGVEWVSITNPLSAGGVVLEDNFSGIAPGITVGAELPILGDELYGKIEGSCYPSKIITDIPGGVSGSTESNATVSFGIGWRK